MRITVNGAPRDVEETATVAVLVETLTPGPRGLAVAVNEEVVPRGRWSGTELRAGDRVELLGAARGG